MHLGRAVAPGSALWYTNVSFAFYWSAKFYDLQLDNGSTQILCNADRKSCIDWCHRHRIDKYLDARRQVATSADCVTAGHFQKSQSQDGGLPEFTNHREATSLWLVKPKQVVADHIWHVVCCNAEYLNFDTQNCTHETLRLFSSDHLLIISIPAAVGLFTSNAPVIGTIGMLLRWWEVTEVLFWNLSALGDTALTRIQFLLLHIDLFPRFLCQHV